MKLRNNSKLILDVTSKIVFGGLWPGQIKKIIRHTAYGVLNAEIFNFKSLHIELCIAITDDIEIRRLNSEFRHLDKSTNVLSFTNENIFNNTQKYVMIGDVVISYETIIREAIEQNKCVIDHLRHMIVHGTLHLLGYDHEKSSQATAMESLEVKILEKMNVSSPYLSTSKGRKKI
jgi:probable rRNA maturation factor